MVGKHFVSFSTGMYRQAESIRIDHAICVNLPFTSATRQHTLLLHFDTQPT